MNDGKPCGRGFRRGKSASESDKSSQVKHIVDRSLIAECFRIELKAYNSVADLPVYVLDLRSSSKVTEL